MTFNHAVHMYGNKLKPYTVSMCVLLSGMGWVCGKYWGMGFGNIFPRVLALIIIVLFIDAIVKSAIFVKDHFRLTLTCKSKD